MSVTGRVITTPRSTMFTTACPSLLLTFTTSPRNHSFSSATSTQHGWFFCGSSSRPDVSPDTHHIPGIFSKNCANCSYGLTICKATGFSAFVTSHITIGTYLIRGHRKVLCMPNSNTNLNTFLSEPHTADQSHPRD